MTDTPTLNTYVPARYLVFHSYVMAIALAVGVSVGALWSLLPLGLGLIIVQTEEFNAS